MSNGGGDQAGLGKCVDVTTKWLEDVAAAGCDSLDEEGLLDDVRFQGAVEIGLNT